MKCPFSDKSHKPYAGEIYNYILKMEKYETDKSRNGEYEFVIKTLNTTNPYI